jgi:hypothetical protein
MTPVIKPFGSSTLGPISPTGLRRISTEAGAGTVFKNRKNLFFQAYVVRAKLKDKGSVV